MNLLIINNDDSIKEKFSQYFDQIDVYPIENIKIDVHSGKKICYINGNKVSDYDSIYIKPNPKAITFSKIFLDSLTGKDINVSMDGTSFYIISKKPYLFKVLREKGVNIPLTYVVPTQKSAKGIEKYIGDKAIYTEYNNFLKKDVKLITEMDQIQMYTENLDSTEKYAIIQKYVEGDVFDCLYVNGNIISTKIDGDSWRLSSKKEGCNEKYHSLTKELKELVTDAANAIGVNLCSVRIVDNNVVNVRADPDLEKFEKLSGKGAFDKVAKMIKPEKKVNHGGQA